MFLPPYASTGSFVQLCKNTGVLLLLSICCTPCRPPPDPKTTDDDTDRTVYIETAQPVINCIPLLNTHSCRTLKNFIIRSCRTHISWPRSFKKAPILKGSWYVWVVRSSSDIACCKLCFGHRANLAPSVNN